MEKPVTQLLITKCHTLHVTACPHSDATRNTVGLSTPALPQTVSHALGRSGVILGDHCLQCSLLLTKKS